LSEDRDFPGVRHVPPRVAQKGASLRVQSAPVQAPQRFGRTEGVQQLRRLARILFVHRRRERCCHPIEQPSE
jgi:hypothetical protein